MLLQSSKWVDDPVSLLKASFTVIADITDASW